MSAPTNRSSRPPTIGFQTNPTPALSPFLAIFVAVAFAFPASQLSAMPASPQAFGEQQPDGSTIHLHLEGDEFFHWLADIRGFTTMSEQMTPRATLTVKATSAGGKVTTFKVRSRIDTPEEMNYYRHGGILQYVLRQLAGSAR